MERNLLKGLHGKKLFLLAVFALFVSGADAQGFLKGLKDKAIQKAKEKIENKVDKKVDETMDKVLDGKSSGQSQKSEAKGDAANNKDDATADAGKEETQKSDFVRGSQIFFNDDVKNEQVGEFPSMWDMRGGSETEVSKLNGVKVIKMGDLSEIAPLMKEYPYLKEEFTIEFDVWSQQVPSGSNSGSYIVFAFESAKNRMTEITICPATMGTEFGYTSDWEMWAESPSGNQVSTEVKYPIVQKLMKRNSWTHVAMSFNKRALKVYVNGTRVFNVPSMKQPDSWYMWVRTIEGQPVYIKDVIMANGAVALYDKNESSNEVDKQMKESGKFVTNNILFETGKAELKTESMAEIMKVCMYMQQNKDVKFEVQGHCDNQGSDKVNDPLSQKRSEAIVKQLVLLGIEPARLTAVGKGSHEPVADNGTEEGRAKNRRVEFVKK